MTGIIGKKLGMSQIFQKDGKMVPVTVVAAGPCSVIQKKTEEKDGYSAVQLGFDEKHPKRTSKPLRGHFKKANVSPQKVLFEFRVKKDELNSYEQGKDITFEAMFKEGDSVDIVGTSKGRGYSGVMKRHGFHGGKASHGVHEYHRHGGSIGQHSYPGRTFPGVKMAGQCGNHRTTVQNLRIARADKEHNILLIKGAVPGAPGGYILIKKTVKNK